MQTSAILMNAKMATSFHRCFIQYKQTHSDGGTQLFDEVDEIWVISYTEEQFHAD